MKRFLILLTLLLAIVAVIHKVYGQNSGARVLTGSAEPPLPFNIIPNATFEDRTTGWSVSSGTFTTTEVFNNVARGRFSASWTVPSSTTAGLSFLSKEVTIPAGLFARSCVGAILYKGLAVTEGGLVIEAWNGTTAYGTVALINSSTYVLGQTLSFSCPSSGTLRLRIRSTTTTPASPVAVFFDDAFLGDLTSFSGSGGQFIVIPSAAITAGASISSGSDVRSIIYVTGSGGAITTSVAAPLSAGSSDGQERVIIGQSDTNTVTIPAGTNMKMNGPAFLKDGSAIGFIWDASNSVWNETYRRD